MRKCGNCYNGHYNLSERGEEMYCDESEFMEEKVAEDYVCDCHRYYRGMNEEQNFMLYDESYIAPGFIIFNVENGKMKKFLKIYDMSEYGFPTFGIRAYSKDATENPDEEFSSIDFTFRDVEDDDNGLFDCFTKLNDSLSGSRIYSLDSTRQGRNNLKLESNSKVTTLTISKDTYHGTQHPTDYIDMIIGDDTSCKKYKEILAFYQSLSKIGVNQASSDIIKKLLLTK